MEQTVSIIVSPEDQVRLAEVIGDLNSPQKHVQRARIVLLSVERRPVIEVARNIGISRPAV
ncbi:putative transposase [Magnetospirillum gryphiswaldense MSR-1 v2]|uniref:Transposase n=1 Tax=Magnetospirillum gryphiswaldense (strain DSM 6361 / JCM 21280 / NBRC 15271 / MSR-1) TaxID=431944 RepID=V6F5E3_MAGGM|nr:putative transposase [Magnetospirillum gryphiswaldense MSR-1 v2]